MRTNRVVRVLKVASIALIAAAVFGEVVTQLWNWLMPAIFGWHAITFWQGLGLLILSKIFFGGFRGRGGFGGPGWRRRFEKMTPEERAQFREGMMRRGGCGRFDAPAPSPEGNAS